jgi:hypothetical protein
MQQRREWREKSGGKEVEDLEEVNEVEDVMEEAGEIEFVEELGSGGDGTNSELDAALETDSLEASAGARVAGVIAAALFSIGGAE